MSTNYVKEQIMHYGPITVSNEDLLKIIIGEKSAHKVKQLLEQYTIFDDDDTDATANVLKIASLPFDDLKSRGSLSDLEAAKISAAVELGVRVALADRYNSKYSVTATNPQVVYDYLSPRMKFLEHEEFVLLLLNCRNQIIANRVLSVGSSTATVVDPKAVFSYALQHKTCCSIIACHNHPSSAKGSSAPSKEDFAIEKLLMEGANTLGLRMADFFILSDGEYFSFQEQGLLKL